MLFRSDELLNKLWFSFSEPVWVHFLDTSPPSWENCYMTTWRTKTMFLWSESLTFAGHFLFMPSSKSAEVSKDQWLSEEDIRLTDGAESDSLTIPTTDVNCWSLTQSDAAETEPDTSYILLRHSLCLFVWCEFGWMGWLSWSECEFPSVGLWAELQLLWHSYGGQPDHGVNSNIWLMASLLCTLGVGLMGVEPMLRSCVRNLCGSLCVFS